MDKRVQTDGRPEQYTSNFNAKSAPAPACKELSLLWCLSCREHHHLSELGAVTRRKGKVAMKKGMQSVVIVSFHFFVSQSPLILFFSLPLFPLDTSAAYSHGNDNDKRFRGPDRVRGQVVDRTFRGHLGTNLRSSDRSQDSPCRL